jgi:hypothetical protein
VKRAIRVAVLAAGLLPAASFPGVLFPAAATGIPDAAAGADSASVRPPKGVRPAPASRGEIDLDSIEIEGRVEQPNVILVPARLDAALQDTSLDRSFKNEIRSGAAGIASPDTFMRRVEPPPSIRSSINRKRK